MGISMKNRFTETEWTGGNIKVLQSILYNLPETGEKMKIQEEHKMEANTTMTYCQNGHPFDTAKSKVCPRCGAKAAGGFTSTEPVGGSGATEPVTAYKPGYTEPVGDTSGDFGETQTAGDDGRDPVVGWLVCVKGPNYGEDYRIHAGYNYIGRTTGDICIRGDDKISRESHAMVAYDSGELAYYFGPAGGRNLVKVNNKTVLNAVEIHAYDTISIGPNTTLIFIPLCGEKFSWETGEQDNG